MKIKKEHLRQIMETAEIEPDQLTVEGFDWAGKPCPGIKVDGVTQLAAFFAAAGVVYSDLYESPLPDFDLRELAKGVVLDSKGLGLVFYWPELELED